MALEPWFLSQNAVSGQVKSNLTLPEFQEKLNESFIEIFGFEHDAYGNIKVEGIGLDKEGILYVDAQTAKVIKAPEQLSAIFDVSRDLHRSLFLKTPGRILVGLASLALVFLAVSGIGLQIKRAGGFRAVFSSIKVLEIKRDGHAQWSRLFLMPILIIAVSGTYLSIVRFTPVPPNKKVLTENTSLDQLLLKDIKKVNYPVMDDEPLVVELVDKHLFFDKNKGTLTKTEVLPVSERLRATNFMLHTGEGTKVWTGILLITSLVMVFLSFTGFQMVAEKWKLKKHKAVLSDDAEIIILVGSETGHTWRFADALEEAFLAKNIKVSILGMENFPKITGNKTLLLLTSTYGNGDAPENTQSLLKKLEEKLSDAQKIQFGVLGFGSSEYPEYCAFAEKLRSELLKLKNTQEFLPYMTVDNQSIVHFIDWVRALNKSQKYDLNIDLKKLHPVRKKNLEVFEIIEKKEQGDTFLLRISHSDKLKIKSGDLLGVYPPTENIERYYSVAAISTTELVLMIKRTGLCSNYLGGLLAGDIFQAYLKRNPTFYRPTIDVPVLMIANGTGIAPFLGMLSGNSTLLWGGRFVSDFELFSEYCNNSNSHFAFSREMDLDYVQDLIVKQEAKVINILQSSGVVMICGSLTMLAGVLTQLEQSLSNHQLPTVDILKKQGKILVDCY